jgi:putative drug exporter of the RND superfamily
MVVGGMARSQRGGEQQGSGLRWRYARWVVSHPWPIVLAWLAAALAASSLLPNVEQSGSGSLGDLVPTDAEALQVEERSLELFRLPLLSRTVVVDDPRGSLSGEQETALAERAADLTLGRLPGLEGIALALAVTDGVLAGDPGAAGAALTYLFFPLEIGPVGQTGLAERLLERRPVVRDPGRSGVTGAVPARGEQIGAITGALPLVELATLALITLVVGLHFRSLLAPLANVATVTITYLASVRLVGGIGQQVGLAVPQEVEPVMVALLFGVITDYVIFYLSRLRGHLREGLEERSAVERTVAELAPTILAAGVSVCAACAALVVAQLGFFRAFGPGLALAVAVALAVVLTLVPALLSLAGGRILWPGGLRGGRPPNPAGWSRRKRRALLRLPTERPLTVALATALPLLALSGLVLQLGLANTLISGLPEDSPPKRAYRLVASEFPAGAVAPLMLVVEEPGIVTRRRGLRLLEDELRERRGFAAVAGPGRLERPLELGAVESPTGDAVRYLIVLDANPFGARGIELVERLRGDLPGLLRDAGFADASYGLAGDTALSEETVANTGADLSRVVPAASLAVFAVLVVFLGALVAPLYLVLSSLLALTSSLGLTVLVFQILLGYGELTFYVPFAGIVLLIALGSDYNVYLVGRIWSEARRRPLREAVRVAAERSTGAIATAGVVLAGSFALLALVPLRPFRELAFLLAAGLLIDAFVVRSLLTPALVSLFGRRGGWPGGRLRKAELQRLGG